MSVISKSFNVDPREVFTQANSSAPSGKLSISIFPFNGSTYQVIRPPVVGSFPYTVNDFADIFDNNVYELSLFSLSYHLYSL